MANLIPLNIDKETGRIVARGGRGGGGNSSGSGYLFEQLSPSNTWTVPHNQKNDQVIVQVYDDVGEFTLPNKITIINVNTVQIDFNAPMEGTAHIMFFK